MWWLLSVENNLATAQQTSWWSLQVRSWEGTGSRLVCRPRESATCIPLFPATYSPLVPSL